MSANASGNHGNRDVVYCHQCEDEWYRDEHGLTPCPACGGEFTEVIENNNDPRGQDESVNAADLFGHFAPDPDEEDIDHFEQRSPSSEAHPGQPPHNYQFQRPSNQQYINPLGSLFQNIFGAANQQSPNSQAPHANQTRIGATYTYQGPNVSVVYTQAPSGGVHNGPEQLDPMAQMMMQMINNIGMRPVHMARGNNPQQENDNEPENLFAGGAFANSPFAPLFSLLGVHNGVMGDVVLNQEALDRIITQTMEAHQTGNAPGPASEEAIASLPSKLIKREDLDDQGKADCSICMEDVTVGTPVTVLPCTHWFHFDCIKAWLGEHDTCPHCRKGIMSKQGDEQARRPGEAPRHDTHSPEYQQAPPTGPFTRTLSNLSSHDGDNTSATSSSQPSNSNSLFSRMRETFGGGGGSNSRTEGEGG